MPLYHICHSTICHSTSMHFRVDVAAECPVLQGWVKAQNTIQEEERTVSAHARQTAQQQRDALKAAVQTGGQNAHSVLEHCDEIIAALPASSGEIFTVEQAFMLPQVIATIVDKIREQMRGTTALMHHEEQTKQTSLVMSPVTAHCHRVLSETAKSTPTQSTSADLPPHSQLNPPACSPRGRPRSATGVVDDFFATSRLSLAPTCPTLEPQPEIDDSTGQLTEHTEENKKLTDTRQNDRNSQACGCIFRDTATLQSEARDLYTLADVNNDGSLSKTEMKKVIQQDLAVRAWLVTGSWQDFFAELDQDSDGQISCEELVDFYVSKFTTCEHGNILLAGGAQATTNNPTVDRHSSLIGERFVTRERSQSADAVCQSTLIQDEVSDMLQRLNSELDLCRVKYLDGVSEEGDLLSMRVLELHEKSKQLQHQLARQCTGDRKPPSRWEQEYAIDEDQVNAEADQNIEQYIEALEAVRTATPRSAVGRSRSSTAVDTVAGEAGGSRPSEGELGLSLNRSDSTTEEDIRQQMIQLQIAQAIRQASSASNSPSLAPSAAGSIALQARRPFTANGNMRVSKLKP